MPDDTPRRSTWHHYDGPPATLGSSLAAGVRIIVTCRSCRHTSEPDIAEQVQRYSADIALADWAARLTCSGCGARDAEFVVSGDTHRDYS